MSKTKKFMLKMSEEEHERSLPGIVFILALRRRNTKGRKDHLVDQRRNEASERAFSKVALPFLLAFAGVSAISQLFARERCLTEGSNAQ